MPFGIETSLYILGGGGGVWVVGKGLQLTLKINGDICLRWGTQAWNEQSPTQKTLRKERTY